MTASKLIAATIVLAILSLSACSSKKTEPTIDPDHWTCESLIPAIIDMSKDRDLKVLEITEPKMESPGGNDMRCSGRAEWSQGYGWIEYGGRVSEGGNVILHYEQK